MVPFFGKAHVGYYSSSGSLAFPARTRHRRVRAPLADAGDHVAEIVRAMRDAEATRRGADARGRAFVHDDAGRAKARRLDRDHPVHGCLSGRPQRTDEIPHHARPARRRVTLSPGRKIPLPNAAAVLHDAQVHSRFRHRKPAVVRHGRPRRDAVGWGRVIGKETGSCPSFRGGVCASAGMGRAGGAASAAAPMTSDFQPTGSVR